MLHTTPQHTAITGHFRPYYSWQWLIKPLLQHKWKREVNGKWLTKAAATAGEIWSFQIKIPTPLSTNYPPTLVKSPIQAFQSQISLGGRQSKYEYVCWGVSVFVWVFNYKWNVYQRGVHTCTPSCIHMLLCFVHLYIVRREGRERRGKSVPVGSTIPAGTVD